ncbi:MAG TPA: hypothetical protein VM118_05255 [Acidobacteriota bacterium]|nr:hypothetical protein [Acidobacteriota bacterium]
MRYHRLIPAVLPNFSGNGMTIVTLSDTCRTAISRLIPVVAFLLPAVSVQACDPAPSFVFRAEARARLDSLEHHSEPWTLVDRIIIMHNLAFHKDKIMRERAEKLLAQYFPKADRPPLLQAYAGSLRMIRVSHRSTGGNVLRTLNPFTKSPFTEARDGFAEISAALDRDSTNPVLRTLRATAATEAADHLSELFPVADADLSWLESHVDSADSVLQFFIHLNRAEYYYKLVGNPNVANPKSAALASVDVALAYACTPVYQELAVEWRWRIEGLSE